MARFLTSLRQWSSDLLAMIFPRLCEVCGSALVHGEESICLECMLALPRTRLHKSDFNEIHKRLVGKAPIERAAGYFYYYRGNPYTRLIHVAKYNGRPHIAAMLASRYASEIAPEGFFDGIDLIIPVPMHRLKRLSRGYNQTDYIARGLSEATGIAIASNLVASRRHSTQTRLGAYGRWLNSQGIYSVADAASLEGKHLLIVDDVITTGATLLSCCEAIHEAAPTARISVLSLAVTHLA